MLKRLIELLGKEVSGVTAFNFVSEISRHHRIQASLGMRAAVNYAVESLKRHGIEAIVKEYPADGETYFWSDLMFKEWTCRDAELRLTEPVEEARNLARWSESKFSLIQRSHSTPGGCCDAEVVVLENGEEESDYRNIIVEGKLVVTNGDIDRVREMAVDRHGAIGVIFDGMRIIPPIRREGDLDDALQYTSFWWSGGEKPSFGFVISPRTGRWLRRLIEDKKKKGEPVKAWAKVDSQLFDGTIENAVATIRGESDEEVIIVAHICHPQPSANDNSSGAGAAMEAMRALQRLITMGSLTRPKRTIRLTLVPEMTGTYAYLADNEANIPNVVAAINLDMVGENQSLCGGPLLVERTPESMSSFVNALLEAIFDEIKTEGRNLSGSSSYALFKHAVSPFSGGSDHYIYSDPSVGVPCPMLIQWPDKYWHTSFDTIDKVDPEMLRKVALMTATYAYFIANAGPTETAWLASEATARAKTKLISDLQRKTSEAIQSKELEKNPESLLSNALLSLKKSSVYMVDRGIETLRITRRLASNDPGLELLESRLTSDLMEAASSNLKLAQDIIKSHGRYMGLSVRMAVQGRPRKLEAETALIIPRRRFRGPVSTRSWVRKLDEPDRDAFWRLEKENRENTILDTLAIYWADGKRDMLEISRLVELEAGRCDLRYLLERFRFLEKMGLIEMIGKKPAKN